MGGVSCADCCAHFRKWVARVCADRRAICNYAFCDGAGNDYLWGDAINYSPSSPGSIIGGKDTLNGGPGNDQLWGGPNNDTFVFKFGCGHDVINDFNQGNAAVGSTAPEHDIINVRDYHFADWNALKAAITEEGGNAVIHLSPNDSVTLLGVHAAALHAADFLVTGGTAQSDGSGGR